MYKSVFVIFRNLRFSIVKKSPQLLVFVIVFGHEKYFFQEGCAFFWKIEQKLKSSLHLRFASNIKALNDGVVGLKVHLRSSQA